MGDPKKFRKKYQTPAHPWIKADIEENKLLTREYGLRTKKEILIAHSFLKKYKNIAKRLIAQDTDQGKKEQEQVLGKLQRLGLLPAGAELSQILNLPINSIFDRRLQSLVYKKGFARTMKQARQFIVHRHVIIAGKEITFPSYLTSLEEEAGISFKEKSALSSEEHPERVNDKKEVKEEVEKIKNAKTNEELAQKKEETTKSEGEK
jgi:small subunit ribosomal protein S4